MWIDKGLKLFGATIRVESAVALSSAVSELYSSCTREQRILAQELKALAAVSLTTKVQVNINTDATSGKCMAARHGPSEKGKQIDLEHCSHQGWDNDLEDDQEWGLQCPANGSEVHFGQWIRIGGARQQITKK